MLGRLLWMIPKNFTKFTGKHLCKRLWYRCFPVNFVKFLRASFLQNTSGRLLLPLLSLIPFSLFHSEQPVLVHFKTFWKTKYVNIFIYRPAEMKKNLGDYQLCNIVGHHSWSTRKIFHFKSSKTARITYYLKKGGNANFHQ